MVTFAPLPNKILNRLEVSAQRTKLISMPVVVDVVLTKACNFACTFCKDYETLGSQRISIKNFEKMAQQLMPSASRLNICSGGEPYLHTGLEDLLRIARRYNPKLHTWVLSNGSILKETRIRTLLEEGLISQHGFSVDGFQASTVEAIRLNAKLPVIIDNIKMLLRIRRELGKTAPTITIRFAAMRNNIEELSDAVRRWGELGIDEMDVGYLSLANDMDRDLSLFYHQDLTSKCFDQARETAKAYPEFRLNLPELIGDQIRYKTNPKKCKMPWEFVMVDTNGQILPCYRAFEALRFGKVYDDDGLAFDKIWNSEQYRRLRASANSSKIDFYPYCKQCENRVGWADERSHIGDEAWIETLGKDWLPENLEHKRPLKGSAKIREP